MALVSGKGTPARSTSCIVSMTRYSLSWSNWIDWEKNPIESETNMPAQGAQGAGFRARGLLGEDRGRRRTAAGGVDVGQPAVVQDAVLRPRPSGCRTGSSGCGRCPGRWRAAPGRWTGRPAVAKSRYCSAFSGLIRSSSRSVAPMALRTSFSRRRRVSSGEVVGRLDDGQGSRGGSPGRPRGSGGGRSRALWSRSRMSVTNDWRATSAPSWLQRGAGAGLGGGRGTAGGGPPRGRPAARRRPAAAGGAAAGVLQGDA